MNTCSVRLEHHNQYQSDNRETNDETKPIMCIIHGDYYLSWHDSIMWLISNFYCYLCGKAAKYTGQL